MNAPAPSRRFMIQQAVLNATKLYEPHTFRTLGTTEGLRCMATTDWSYVRTDFCDVIRACYRDLASRYSEAGVMLARSPACRSALKMPKDIPTIKVCPCCAVPPSIDPDFYEQICIYCDTDSCEGMGEKHGYERFQAMGHTVAEAAAKWNARAATLKTDNEIAGEGAK